MNLNMNVQAYLRNADRAFFDQGKYRMLDDAMGRYFHFTLEACLNHRIGLTEFLTVERFNMCSDLLDRLWFC